VLAGNGDVGGFVLFAGDTAEDGLLDDGDFVLVRAGNSAFLASGLDAHGCVLNFWILLQIADVHFPQIERALNLNSRSYLVGSSLFP
jgi:hypothetical protein